MEIQMDQLQAWFHMAAYLIDRGRQACVTNYFQSCEGSGTLYNSNMIISLKENCTQKMIYF